MGGGNMFGGMLGSIAASLITDLLVDAVTSSATASAGAAASGNIPGQNLSTQASALQRAVEQQRRFQEEREKQLLSNMLDVSANQFKDSSSDLTILENASARAGMAFDGTSLLPDSQWSSMHDAWFSTSSAGQATGTQPLRMSDKILDYSKDSMDSLKCISSMGGQLCSFPSGKAPVMRLDTISVPPPSANMTTNVPLNAAPTVKSQWIPYKDSIIATARRTIMDYAEQIADPRTQADMLVTTYLDFGSQALPGIQGEIASRNIETYKGFMNNLIANTFEILTDAIYNPEEAIRKSDPEELAKFTRDSMLESASPYGKVILSSLTGRPDEAFQESNKVILDELKETVTDKIKEKAEDTAKKYLEKMDHWLMKL
ncbi:MAG: hypothetical protein NTX75_11645 [Proteobacteria bacterium]|nr:hypothetical protein [Pseudomonadota bacterium]